MNKEGPIPDLEKYPMLSGPCWNWTACKTRHGYGQVRINYRLYYSHRVAWKILNGEFDDDLDVLHKCDNPSCVNPDHLILGSHQDNMDDATIKQRIPGGEIHHWAKLSEKEVLEIRERYAIGGISQRTLGDMYGVTRLAIHYIVRRKNWRRI